MRAPISVIIPTLNVTAQLGPCLAALSDALGEGLLAEVIFADGGSNDDIAQIADEVGANFIPCPQGRGNQMANAAKTAQGEWLLFLHADSVLQTGWRGAVREHMRDTSCAGYFRLRFDDSGPAARIVAAWANFRAKTFGLPYGDQGLLISRKLYDAIDGFSEIPLMEDVDMAKKLRGKFTPLPADIVTSAEKYRQQGWLRQSFFNFGMLMRYKFGAKPEALAKAYRR